MPLTLETLERIQVVSRQQPANCFETRFATRGGGGGVVRRIDITSTSIEFMSDFEYCTANAPGYDSQPAVANVIHVNVGWKL